MKNISITISYDEEKLAALKLYLSQKNQRVEDELIASLEALYSKTVPANVREFIDLRAGVPVPEAKKRKMNTMTSTKTKPSTRMIRRKKISSGWDCDGFDSDKTFETEADQRVS